MNRTVSKFTLAAGLVFAMAFTFSCSVVEDIGGSSSSSSGGNSFSYCLISGQCLGGPFTSKECGDLGGLPSNSCNGSGKSSSSGGGGGGSSSSGGGGGGGYTGPYGSVSHGGKTYKTVVIGTQTWMAENLNYDPGTGNSACYDNQASNCDTYGRLYDWETAMEVCPSGWHIPSDDEWTVLTDYVGGSSGAGTKLKSTSGWNDNGNGTNSYGFSALPVGARGLDGSFINVGYYGGWWSATEDDSYYAYDRSMFYNISSVFRSKYNKSYLFSVRCVQDNTGGGGNPGGNVSRCPVSTVSNNSVTCGGQTYRTVQIGTQKWFAENLNYNVAGSKCYYNDPANCTKYGRLYDWNTAKTVCPNGWHLPSYDELDVLTTAVGGNSAGTKFSAGTKLKATSGWEDCGPSGSGKPYLCEDSFGFSALPGGEGFSDGSFSSVDFGGLWWSASESESHSNNAYSLGMDFFSDSADGHDIYKSTLSSVRCVQD